LLKHKINLYIYLIFFGTIIGCQSKNEPVNDEKKDICIISKIDTTINLGDVNLKLISGNYSLSVSNKNKTFNASLSSIFKRINKFLSNDIYLLTQNKDCLVLRVLYGMNSHSDIIVYPFLNLKEKVFIIDDIIQINHIEYYKFITPNQKDTSLSMIHFDLNNRLLDTITFNHLNPNKVNYIDDFDTVYKNNNNYNVIINKKNYPSF